MLKRKIPSPDAALKEFFRNNAVYADVFNSFFFKNESVINPDDLEKDDTAYVATIRLKGKSKYKTERINKYRDNIRRTSLGYLVILGIEDQNKIHYSMPVRKVLYDALSYSTELTELGHVQDSTEWTVDERLSKIKKGTKITPVITVVFYTGEDPWDGPKSLHEMMEIDDRIRPFVPDYPLYVIDIGHDKDLSFNNKKLSELKEVLSSIYDKSADTNETEVETSTIALSGILAGDENLYYSAVESNGRRQKMCKALQERDEIIINKIVKTKDAEFAKEKAKIIAEKDARIKELEAQLATVKN